VKESATNGSDQLKSPIRIDGFESWKSARERSKKIDLDPRERWLLRNVCGLVLDVGCGEGLLTEYFGAIGVDPERFVHLQGELVIP